MFRRRGAHFKPRESRLPLDVALVFEGERLVPCRCARGFFGRLRGLIGVPPQTYAKEALLLTNCVSIHTNGMAYPIDVLFIDVNPCACKGGSATRDGCYVGNARVMASYRAVPPGEVLSCPGSRAVVERPASDDIWPMRGDPLMFVYREGGIEDVEGLQPLVRT